MPKIKEMRDEANNALETCNMILRIGVSGFEKNKDSLRSSGFNDDGLPNKAFEFEKRSPRHKISLV